jgi:HEAT repeat protein
VLPKDYITQIVELLKDTNSEVRNSAAKALGQQEELSEEHIAKIAELLKRPE